MGEAVGYIRLNVEDFNKNAKAVNSAVKEIETQLSGLDKVCSAVAKAAAAAFSALSIAATAAFKSAISTGAQFESAMSQVGATMGMTVEDISSTTGEFQQLKEAAMEAGATTKFSATQSADALNYLALAGYDASESISALPTVLDLAAAGGMDLALASDMLTDSVSALGLGLDDMAFFADQMAKTAQSSNTSVEQLGNAILQIGGTAKSLAGGVTELDTALGILANNGIKSAEAGTALRQIILNLTAPTDKAREYMKELGLAVKDAAGNVRPLNDIFRDLDEILQSKGITGTADMTEALANIFDARQLKSANALLANYGDTWDELYYKIENAEGAASTMAEVMSANLTGAITTFKSALEGVAISFSEAFTGKLTEAVNTATGNMRQLNEAMSSPIVQAALSSIADTISDVVVKLSEFAVEAIPAVLEKIDWLIHNFSILTDAIFSLSPAIIALGTAFAGIKISSLAASGAFTAILTTIGPLVSAIGPVIAAITALSVAYTAVSTAVRMHEAEIEQLTDIISQEYSAIYDSKDAVDKLAESYSNATEKNEELIQKNNEKIDTLKSALDMVKENVDENGKLTGSEELLKEQIQELNGILPDYINYQNGEIENYEDLTEKIELYCAQLEREARLKAAISGKMNAEETYNAALANRATLQEDINKATEENAKAQKILNDVSKGYVSEEAIEAANAAGKSTKDWIEANALAAQAAVDAANEAYDENERIIQQSAADLDKYKNDVINTENEIFFAEANASADAIGAQKAFANARAKEYAQQAQAEDEARKQAAEERAEAEIANQEELDAKLDELERQRNLGIIDNDKDYHDQRLKLYEDYEGEKTLIYSQGYRKELDWQTSYNEQQRKAAEDAAEEQRKQREAAQKEAERQAAEEKKQREKDIRDRIAYYDKRREIDKNYSDEEYLSDLTGLQQYVDKESDIYKELEEKKTDFVKEQAQKRLDAEYDTLQERKKLNKDYTDEQYLADLQAFADKLDKESDLYKEVAAEIMEVSDDIAEKQQEAADKSFEAWEDGLNDIMDAAEKEYDSIMSKQKSLEDMLNGQIDLFELVTKKAYNSATGLWEDVESEQISKEYLDKQYNDIVGFEKKLQSLKDRGISDSLMSKILSMSPEDQKKIVDQLGKMSDSSLAEYDRSYNRLLTKNKEFAEQFYSDELDTFKQSFGDEVADYFLKLPEDAKKAGKDTVKAFVDGVQEGDSPDFIKDTIGMEWGKNERLFSDEGTLAGNAFFNSFAASITGIKGLLSNLISIPEAQSKINELMRSMHTAVPSTAYSSAFDPTNAKQAEFVNNAEILGSSLTKEDLIEAIQFAMPSGDVILNVAGEAFASVSRKALNRSAVGAGDMGLQT